MELLWVILAVPLPPEPPTLADCARFPPAAVCQAMEDFGKAHLEWLEARASLAVGDGAHDYWQARRAEARWCFDVWDWCGACAGCEGMEEHRRVLALRHLRDLLGDEDYEAGRLPPPVPVWRFRRLD